MAIDDAFYDELVKMRGDSPGEIKLSETWWLVKFRYKTLLLDEFGPLDYIKYLEELVTSALKKTEPTKPLPPPKAEDVVLWTEGGMVRCRWLKNTQYFPSIEGGIKWIHDHEGRLK
jgi:hypothetical protein